MTWLTSLAPAAQTEYFRPSQYTGPLALAWPLGGVLVLLHQLASGRLAKTWKDHGKPAMNVLVSVFWGVVVGQLFFLLLFFTSVTQSLSLSLQAQAHPIQAMKDLGRDQGWLDETGALLASARPQWCVQARMWVDAAPTQALAFPEGREVALVMVGANVDKLRKNECISDAQWVEKLASLHALALENPSQSFWLSRHASWLPILGHLSQTADVIVERLRPTPAAMCGRLLDKQVATLGWNADTCTNRFDTRRPAAAADVQAIREAMSAR